MIFSYLMGGLGNYMFQIAAGYSAAKRQNLNYSVNKKYMDIVHNPFFEYGNNIFKNIKISDEEPIDVYHEPTFEYKPIPLFSSRTIIKGYFQSEKYFADLKYEIKNLYECPQELKTKIFSKYPDINYNDTCSIHVRRGDYLNLQAFHPCLGVDYYKKCISMLDSKTTFFVFSDDIEWCKKNLHFINNLIFVESNKDYEDFYLMSFCKNNIIANSTFSWWAAWLNPNENKQIICPHHWFGENYKHINTEDLYCNKWKII